MHQKTLELGYFFSGYKVDYMVRGKEASKCHKVELMEQAVCWKLKILLSSMFQYVGPECPKIELGRRLMLFHLASVWLQLRVAGQSNVSAMLVM